MQGIEGLTATAGEAFAQRDAARGDIAQSDTARAVVGRLAGRIAGPERQR